MTDTATKKLDRREAVKFLLEDRGDMLLVSSLGGPSYDLTAATGEHALDYCLGGAMGGCTMFGFGLSIAQPSRRVISFCGDGEMLMSLGSLAAIGAEKPKNFGIVVIDNEFYAETGMQKTHTGRGVDLVGVAKSCGFDAHQVRTQDELVDARKALRNAEGPCFVSLKVENNIPPLFSRIRDGVWNKGKFRMALLGHV